MRERSGEGIYRRGEKAAKVNINIYKVSPRIAFTWILSYGMLLLLILCEDFFFLSFFQKRKKWGECEFFLWSKHVLGNYNFAMLKVHSRMRERQCWWILKLLYCNRLPFVKMNFIITEAAAHHLRITAESSKEFFHVKWFNFFFSCRLRDQHVAAQKISLNFFYFL